MEYAIRWRLRNLIGILCLVTVATALPEAAGAQSTDAFLTNFIKALNASMPPDGNPMLVTNVFAPDGVQHRLNQDQVQRGREELHAFFASFKERWADWTQVEKSRIVEGNRAVWEGTSQGHHKETGKFVKLPLVFILEFDAQGHIKESRIYVDAHLIAEQLK
jgi:ketosteroid isomerase-like protein